MTTTQLLAPLLGYLIGSLPFAVIVSRAMGLADPRSFGSGNPGATNVLRSGSKTAALLTLLGDAGKGSLAIVLATHFFGEQTAALTGLAAFLGHLFPLFLSFKGGKGVSTAAGVLLAIKPALGLATLLVWLMVALATRYSSLAAICAALFAPCAALWFFGPTQTVAATAIMSALLIWRHRANLQRLRAGTESKIGGKKKAAA